MTFFSGNISHLELFSLGTITALMLAIGFAVYVSNKKSATNVAFFVLAIVAVMWSLANFLIYQSSDSNVVLWLMRALLFFATWFAFALFYFYTVFPGDSFKSSPYVRFVLVPISICVSLLTLTPYVFERILAFGADGRVESVSTGTGIALFGIYVVPLVIFSFVLLLVKTRRATHVVRRSYEIILAGTTITFSLILFFNFVLPAFFQNSTYVTFGSLFILPFIAATAYAIMRHHLFNIKIISTAILCALLAILAIVDVLLSDQLFTLLFRAAVFTLVLGVGFLLIRGVFREVQQRELIEKQEKELEEVNRQQEGLLHFISHEVKGYLTKGEAAFAAIYAGDYGEVNSKLHTMSGLALADTRKGVNTVIDILDASNLKRGTVSFAKNSFDLSKEIQEIVRDLEMAAHEKGLSLMYEKPVTGAHMMIGDEDKIRRHVLRNIIDNSIKYTPHGHVRVELSRNESHYRITVSDTGVGITPEDMKKLFTEGGKGADSLRINVHSTGYGLFIAKAIVEGHGGKVWAESEGAGKGSRFIIELPVV